MMAGPPPGFDALMQRKYDILGQHADAAMLGAQAGMVGAQAQGTRANAESGLIGAQTGQVAPNAAAARALDFARAGQAGAESGYLGAMSKNLGLEQYGTPDPVAAALGRRLNAGQLTAGDPTVSADDAVGLRQSLTGGSAPNMTPRPGGGGVNFDDLYRGAPTQAPNYGAWGAPVQGFANGTDNVLPVSAANYVPARDAQTFGYPAAGLGAPLGPPAAGPVAGPAAGARYPQAGYANGVPVPAGATALPAGPATAPGGSRGGPDAWGLSTPLGHSRVTGPEGSWDELPSIPITTSIDGQRPTRLSKPGAYGGYNHHPYVAGGDSYYQQDGYASGTAKVPGKGSGMVDKVPAMLAPGEAVLNKGAAEHFGRDNIAALNSLGHAKMQAEQGARPPAQAAPQKAPQKPAGGPPAKPAPSAPAKGAKPAGRPGAKPETLHAAKGCTKVQELSKGTHEVKVGKSATTPKIAPGALQALAGMLGQGGGGGTAPPALGPGGAGGPPQRGGGMV